MSFNEPFGVAGDLSEEQIEVIAPSGSPFNVMNEAEKRYFEKTASDYLRDNRFSNTSDLQDLDRILIMETMCWRWGLWLSQEKDYWGGDLDLEIIRKSLNDYSKELRLLKKSLGIDKASRDKDKGEDVSSYIMELGHRAREFVVMRNEQAVKAITLFQEFIALITLHDNCTPEERKENHVEEKDILEWGRQVAEEFKEIDRKFRETSQQYWIREQ